MNKEIIKYLLIFISLSAVALLISYYQIKNHEKEVLKQEKEMLSIAYNTITKAYKTHSEIIFDTKINVPEVHALMKKANSTDIGEKNSARGELYSLLINSYNSMKIFKIKQLHFHLPNNESFLRFHRVEKFGDSLEGIRDTVAYVNRYKEPVSGFEEGRIYNGYRYIYPIVDREQHYGSVEISVSMHEIVKHLRDEAIADVEFIIRKDIVEKKVFENEKSNYLQSKINSNYLYERVISGDGNKLIEEITAKHSDLDENILSGEAFNFFTCLDNRFYITTFIPVFNKYSNQQVAYIVVNRSNPSIEYMFKKDRVINSIMILLLALLTYFYYKMRKKHEIFEKNNRMLNEIQLIAKLGSWELEAKTNKLRWSDEVYNILGLKPQSFEPTYEIFLSYVHPDDKDKVDEKFIESINNKSVYQVQHRIIKNDGTVAYLNESAYHTYNEGEHIYSIGTVHDVTHIIAYEEKILHIQNELQSIVDHIPDIIFRSKTDKEMTMLFINSAVYKITGYKAQAFILNRVRNYRDLIHPDDREAVESKIQEAIKNRAEYSIEYRILNSLGDVVWVKESAEMSIDEEAQECIEGVITDITHQKGTMEKLRKFIDIQDSIVLLTDSRKILFANQKFFDFFGYEDLEDFSKEYPCISNLFVEDETFFHVGKMLPKEEHWIRSLLNLPGRERIVSMLNREKKAHAFSVSINSYDPQTYVVNFSDISDTMFEKLQLKQKAIRDQLTGAYNRTFFDSSVHSIINNNESQNGKTGIILFDIDHFKDINDNYGHAAGDEVLKALVEIVGRFTRKEDKLIRWGGEEFVVIMYAKTIGDIARQAEHLRFVIQNHKFDHLPTITCSFGVALHEHDERIEESIKRADEKLYEAKRGGRNQVRS
ncbi:diguanylate cyclase [Sulfurimonas sp.]|jgi:diguanylate cyclase (GGDEF)-like protein/PAS domain S-box-containing protein|uniref:diguanylate cyclase n=1 Tax=Sulfurimonas sp. TaxID=2022749 RepID=UPI002A35F648|nr:diguanylate cyclase [Sulfurimonas sp.]MDY0124075.1 diguanylate cyclase [Sulfurimonas sp.]